MGIHAIQENEYPKLLRDIGKDAPKQLYYKGNWNEGIFENCLAVVGSRRMTNYGKQVAEKIVGEIAAAGVTIVSGFMYGIDVAAHKAALSVGGKTIAVMPCGIDLIHPEYQQDLYVEILNNKGLVISEYEGSFAPALWTYPRRNRIVAGLAKAVLIVEAAEKSGSLITANWAKKFKRKVFVVPGPITSENSKGIMQLIREGAEPVGSAEEILDFFRSHSAFSSRFIPLKREPYAFQKNQNVRDNPLESRILDKLSREPSEIDSLSRSLGISIGELGTILSIMELKGIIKKEGTKYYLC